MKHITKKQALLGVFSFFMVGTLSFLMTSNMKKSDATMAGFSAGNIISDYVMGNYNSMNESQIQAFLKSKNSCNDTGTYKAQQYPNYSYHIVNGHFVCMADENFNGESAAHIIYRAAQDYRINPQVLIVLLQKEQGLVTDTWPNSVQYRSATGYGCPDTAACDSQYYGLKNQIRNAAELYRWILDHGSKYYPVGWNNVRFSPNAACGSSRVNIENNATAALYQYTPYQPNAAAINAGYGTGDACSAYGNRNFYNYFTDWFGDTRKSMPTLEYIKSHMSKIAKEKTEISFTNNVHISNYGWMGESNGGEMIGTTGFSVPIEAITIKLNNNLKGIEYKTHVQDYGWTNWAKNGEISGTTGQSKHIEAIQIKLADELAKNYDIYYKTHVQDYGWTNWAKNGEISGTTGQSKHIEAIQIKIVEKKLVKYTSHVQDYGWMNWVKNSETAGTTGQSKRTEGVKIELIDTLAGNDIQYRVHVQDYGWMDWVKNGQTAGTTGQSKRMEAIEIKLSDKLSKQYDIQYRVHVQDYGWMDWAKNGQTAGTTGQSKRMEALEIKLVKR